MRFQPYTVFPLSSVPMRQWRATSRRSPRRTGERSSSGGRPTDRRSWCSRRMTRRHCRLELSFKPFSFISLPSCSGNELRFTTHTPCSPLRTQAEAQVGGALTGPQLLHGARRGPNTNWGRLSHGSRHRTRWDNLIYVSELYLWYFEFRLLAFDCSMSSIIITAGKKSLIDRVTGQLKLY